ncbi:hypothetical protein GCM10009539_56500 [Cryptosporangium japonicum]|uniref:Uncharacterized protein n=1 Tax=Cryptosporangium japonicum TaxID=80872 RepID=A0ABP3EJQ3_9ACTN
MGLCAVGVGLGAGGAGDGGLGAGRLGGVGLGTGVFVGMGLASGELGLVDSGAAAPGVDGVADESGSALVSGAPGVGVTRWASAEEASGGSTGSVPNSQSPGTIGCGNGAGAGSEKDGRPFGGGNTSGSLLEVGTSGAGDPVDADGPGTGGRASPHPAKCTINTTMTAPRNRTHSSPQGRVCRLCQR